MTFSPVCLPPDLPSLPDKSKGHCLNDITITYSDILYKLNRLNPNKYCGPDNCHPHVLKEVKDGLILPLFVYLTNYCRNPVYLFVGNWHQSLLFIRKGTYHFQAITALSALPQNA